MDFLPKILTRVVIGLFSIIDASSLRTRLYNTKEEHEIMWTALDDISRMYPDDPAGQYAKQTLKQINSKYGR